MPPIKLADVFFILFKFRSIIYDWLYNIHISHFIKLFISKKDMPNSDERKEN